MYIDNLISQINNKCRNSISSDFKLIKTNSLYNLSYVIEGNGTALNRFDYPQERVKVLKWFDDVWLYIEIKAFGKTKNRKINIEKINISISVFQGDEYNEDKFQLFRAEWDDYNNTNEKHAQPHWHITTNQALENSFLKYSDTFEKQDYIDLLESEKKKVYEIKNMHFAMSGNWQEKPHFIHKIESEEQIVNWIQGLLGHVREELQYLSV